MIRFLLLFCFSTVTLAGTLTDQSHTEVNQINGVGMGPTFVRISDGSASVSVCTSGLQTTANGYLSSIVTNTSGLGLAQGSTTSGQLGSLNMGAVTTASPSYTTGQSSPLSLDTSGNLRVNVVTGGTSGTVAQGSTTSGQSGMMIQGAVTTSAPSYTTGQTNPISLTTAGAIRVDGGAVTQPVAMISSIPAGTAIIGKVGIDQTTPGTTNLVSAGQNGSWTVTANAGTGNFNDASIAANSGTAPTSSSLVASKDNSGNIIPLSSKPLNVQVTGTDNGVIVNSVIHGLTTAGGGTYVDVKVNPSGALAVDASGSTLGANGGVDIGDVTINNGTGAAAVNIQDGGNSITVDGTITANAGTNLNTSALALESGGNLAAIKTDADNVSATTGSVSAGTAGTKSQLMGGVYNTTAPAPTDGQQVAVQLDPSANLRATSAPLRTTFTFTANTQNLDITLQGHNTVSLTIASGTSTLVGTLTPSCIFGGSGNVVATNFINVTTGAVTATQVTASATAYNLGILVCPGATGIRVATTAYTSGSGVAYLNATYAVNLTAPLPAGAQVIGAVTQSGTWTSRTTGNAGGAVDAANNGTAPANVWVAGVQLRDTTTATAGTVGQVGSPVASLDHVLYVRNGGPVVWQCGLDAIGATLTQCQAAAGAGTSLYVTGWISQSTTTTAGQMTLESGTGTNCGTGTATLLAATATARFSSPANTSPPAVVNLPVPLKLPAATALCVLGVATNTTSIQIFGYTAP